VLSDDIVVMLFFASSLIFLSHFSAQELRLFSTSFQAFAIVLISAIVAFILSLATCTAIFKFQIILIVV
jgi:hypothetical protein